MVKIERMLVMSSGLCIICYLMAASRPIPSFSLMGCASAGWEHRPDVAGHPEHVRRASAGGTAMFGVLAIFGDLAASVGPWLTACVRPHYENLPSVELANSAQITLEQVKFKGGLTGGGFRPSC